MDGHVANLKDGDLVIFAQSGAAAVRLKQMLPSVIKQLNIAGHAIQSIKVKVGTPEQMAPERPPPQRQISESAKADLHDFADTLPADSPLRASIERLIRRA